MQKCLARMRPRATTAASCGPVLTYGNLIVGGSFLVTGVGGPPAQCGSVAGEPPLAS